MSDQAKTMAEVLAEHWSASTHTEVQPTVDKCDGCGAVLREWGDDSDMPAQLAAHQAAALTAAGFGLVADDKRRMELAALLAYEAVEEGALREAGAKALEEAVVDLVKDRPILVAPWLRARAAEMRQG